MMNTSELPGSPASWATTPKSTSPNRFVVALPQNDAGAVRPAGLGVERIITPPNVRRYARQSKVEFVAVVRVIEIAPGRRAVLASGVDHGVRSIERVGFVGRGAQRAR